MEIKGWDWPDLPPPAHRPMANCLRPCSIPWRAYLNNPNHQLAPGRNIPYEDLDLMQAFAGSYIETKKGVRRLMHDELSKGLGVPLSWLNHKYPKGNLVEQMVGVYLFEYLTNALHEQTKADNKTSADELEDEGGAYATSSRLLIHEESIEDDDEPYSWKPPIIAKDSPWYRDRVGNLEKAAKFCFGEDPTSVIEEGLQALKHHRSNYTETHTEPKYLQLLWWEFPYEHWAALRNGSSMKFLHEPPLGMHDNSPMDEAQLAIACKFTDELLDLGVLVKMETSSTRW
jgi:hypothetical protein